MLSRLARLIRAIGHWLEDRTGLWSVSRRLAEHPVPPGTDWRYVLGGATLVAFLLQVATGVALATVYVPSTGSAYQSLQFITHDAPFGRVLRGMHYFGASAMVVLIGAHMSRVFLTGSYKFPREMNWLSGAALLLLTILMAFTGQLLRWDQDGVWSAVVASEQAARIPALGHWLAHLVLGGATVSGPTLSRSFAVHVFLIPALIFAGVGLHLYLVLRTGVSERASIGPAVVDPATYRAWYRNLLDREGQPFWPDAAWRDAVVAVLVVGTVLALALIVGPKPLGKPPDPTIIIASRCWRFSREASNPPSSYSPPSSSGSRSSSCHSSQIVGGVRCDTARGLWSWWPPPYSRLPGIRGSAFGPRGRPILTRGHSRRRQSQAAIQLSWRGPHSFTRAGASTATSSMVRAAVADLT